MVFERIKDRYAVRRPEKSYEYQPGHVQGQEIHRQTERSEYNPPEEKKESRFSRALKTTPRDIRGQVAQRRETWSAGRAGKREISEYKKRKEEEQEDKRSFEKSKEAYQRLKRASYRKTEAGMVIKARAVEKKAKRAEFRAEHPHITAVGDTAERSKERLKKVADKGYTEVAKAYGTATGRSYMTGQQIARQQQMKAPKTGGKQKAGREVTRTLSSETVGVSGLSAGILQESYGLRGAEQPRDLLGGLGGGLKQDVNYFGSQKKNGNGIGIGVKKIDFLGEIKKKKQRYY